MKTGVEKIIQAKGGDAPAKNQTGVQKIIELLGGDPPAKNQTGVDKIVEILENGGGGGNPNRVETITGTIENPFGDLSTAEIESLATALKNNQASAYMQADLSNLGYQGVVIDLSVATYADTDIIATYDHLIVFGVDTFTFLQAIWEKGLDGYYLMSCEELEVTSFDDETSTGEYQIVVFDDYASLITTTLTIIWHPLPEQS